MPRPGSSCRAPGRWGLLLPAVITIGVCLLPGPSAAAAQPPGANGSSGETLLLLQVQLGTLTIADAILTVYESPEGYHVPLGALMRALELGVFTDPQTGTADGFILQESRRFSLDAADYTAIVDGERHRFNADQVTVFPDDIYVRVDLLSTWFPINLSVDRFAAVLQVESREPLPLEMRIEREARLDRLRSRRERTVPVYPRLDNPYALWNGPSIDQSVSLSFDGDTTGTFDRTLEYDTRATGDVFGLNGSLSISGDLSESPPSIRWTLGRKDPNPVLLGPLRVRRFSFGHVGQPGMELVSNGHAGQGVTISSFPLQAESNYGTTRFEGELPPGWEVELYRNNVLIDFAGSDGTGRYQFEDVSLIYGDNVFRFVFYGPQGQHREETTYLNIGRSLTPPGESYYSATVTQDPDGYVRGSARYEVGAEGNWAGTVQAAALPVNGAEQTFFRAGLAHSFHRVLAHSDLTWGEGAGTAARVGFQTELGPANIGFDHTRFSSARPWETERYPASRDPLVSESALRLTGRLTPSFTQPISASLELEYDRRQSGATFTDVSNRLSTRSFGVSFTNFLEGTIQGASHNVDGTLLATDLIGPYRIRAEMKYDVTPRLSPQNVRISADRPIDDTYSMRAGFSHSLQAGASTLSAGFSRRANTHTLGLSVSYATNQEWTAGVNLSFGIGRDPRRGSFELSRSGVAAAGAASVQVFLDADGDGDMDPGEEPLEGVGILVNGRSTEPLTGPDGISLVRSVSTDQLSSISIDATTLVDPLKVPGVDGVSVFAHPGAPVKVDLPVVQTSELIGTVYVQIDGEKRAVSGVELELVDESGNVAHAATSLYEGFFALPNVRPGNYVLRASPEQLSRLGVAPSPGAEIDVPGSGGFLDGLELVIYAE